MQHLMLVSILVATWLPGQWQAVDEVAQIVQFTGFETGDLGEFAAVTGTAAVQNNLVRSGNHAMRCEVAGDGYSYATIFREHPNGRTGADLNLTDMYVSFWFRYAQATNRSRIAEVGGVGPGSGATKIRLELEADRRLSLQDFRDTIRFIGTQTLAPDTWYRIRWYVGTGLVAGTVLMVDDAVEISLPDANLSDQPTRRFHLGRSSTVGGAIDFYFDDLIISAGGFADDCEVKLLLPDAAGAHTAWAGTSEDVDDWPHDADGTFSESTGVSTAMTFSLQDAAAAGIAGPVVAVKALGVVRRDGGAPGSALRVRSGATDFDTQESDPSASYVLLSRLFALDPATSLAWTLAGLDAVEVGAVHGSGSGTPRITAAGASVLQLRP
jgi:hypothetical protein